MQHVICQHCQKDFDFDPKDVWSSPGTIGKLDPAKPPSLAIQCPHCKQWSIIELRMDAPE